MSSVHIVDDVSGLGEGPFPLLVALHGFLDAGRAAPLAVAHVEGEEPGPVVATFDVDGFHDYRARRPAITFARDHYEGYEAPRLLVRMNRDAEGRPYLLLSGPEPDTRWEAFAVATREVVERLSVDLVVALGSVPMAAPHSRPLTMTQHANQTDLLRQESQWEGELRVPASAQALLEIRLAESGHPMTGYVAHVPHYVADSDYPLAAQRLLEAVQLSTSLRFDVGGLETAAQERAAEIDTYLEEHPEVREVVTGLEQQYDAFVRSESSSSNLLAEGETLPSADELGEQFQRFLAGQADTDRPDDGGEGPGDPGDHPGDQP